MAAIINLLIALCMLFAGWNAIAVIAILCAIGCLLIDRADAQDVALREKRMSEFYRKQMAR